jgi:hypothetical protein
MKCCSNCTSFRKKINEVLKVASEEMYKALQADAQGAVMLVQHAGAGAKGQASDSDVEDVDLPEEV